MTTSFSNWQWPLVAAILLRTISGTSGEQKNGGIAAVDQLLASAAAEKLSALMTVEHLRERARHARREDFVAFLNGSPDVPPVPGDEP